MPKSSLNQPSSAPEAALQRQGLGTFGGVYTPSLLTILGVIMYLRFGWVVANVGLIPTLVIVTLATAITLLTTLSISAIATDQVVRTGGAYYMISRSLGIETGGAIGIPLYFAQAFAIALYTLGFSESLVWAFPQLNLTLVAVITTILVAAIALKSADIAIKVQYVIMGAIGVSLISLALGSPLAGSSPELMSLPIPEAEDFWTVFAVFFPAVTGIMAGVNMSGDLKDPSRSIPSGTLAAVGTSYVIYMLLPIVLAARSDFSSLASDPLIMRRLAVWGDAILLGVWGATLSSAIGSILGAPRVLQALARDGVLPRSLQWLGHGHGPMDEPRRGTFFTLGVALVVVAMGDLNAVAPVLSMFFLTTYLVLNAAAGIETFLNSPSFRPSFRVHWFFSLAGAVGCAAVMLLINAFATAVAIAIVLGIYFWLERQELESAWGDVRRGLWLSLVRLGLLLLDTAPDDPKNWRPNLLVLSGIPTRRWHLIRLADALTHQRGFVTVASILSEKNRNIAQQAATENLIRDYLKRQRVQAFVRVVTATNPFEGAERLVEAYGIGPLMPNTVLLGCSEAPEHRDRYCQMIANFHQAQLNVLILRTSFNDQSTFPDQCQRIDVWWGGLKGNGGLMLILGYLLRTSQIWQRSQVTLKLVVPDQEAAQAAQENLEETVDRLRIGAQCQVIVAEDRPFAEILKTSSQTADLVILGMADPDDAFRLYFDRLLHHTAGLPTILFVLAAQKLAFAEVLVKD